MQATLLIVQVLLAVGIIFLVLIQRSEQDGFGLGGGGGGLVSGRAKANFFTRATAWLAGLFMLNSMALAFITARETSTSLVDKIAVPVESAAEKELRVDDTKEKEPELRVPTPGARGELRVPTPDVPASAPAQKPTAKSAKPEASPATQTETSTPTPAVPRPE